MHRLPRGNSLVPFGFVTLSIIVMAHDACAQQKQQQPSKSAIEQAQKKMADEAQKAAKDVLLQNLASTLVQPYVLLSVADYSYGGHRSKAVTNVKSATNSLKSKFLDSYPGVQTSVNMIKAYNKLAAKYSNWDGRQFYDKDGFSDYLLFQASAQLATARIGIADSNQPSTTKTSTTPQTSALKSIDSALNEIQTALTVEAPKRIQRAFKGKEAQALMEAFVLLQAAEHDYDGHRANAVRSLRTAIGALNSQVGGSLSQESTNIAIESGRQGMNDLAGALAKSDKSKSAKAWRQYVSDMMVYEALGITSNVSQLLGLNDQHAAFDSMATAIKEMGIALKIR
jgi:hypothetical protein